MADGGDQEAFLTSDYNAEMVEHVARYPRLRDRSVFVGDPEDLVGDPLGPGLPSIRDWTLEHFDFTGYVMGERPDPADSGPLRRRLGYADDEVVCLVSVGGSAVGAPLLRRIIDSYDAAAGRVPGLTHARRHRSAAQEPRRTSPHRAASTSTGSCPTSTCTTPRATSRSSRAGCPPPWKRTAAGRPFLYFPLRHHFEQQVHVRHRLERHRAGRAMDYAAADPDSVADALVDELARPRDYLPVPGDGAHRAAALLAEVL